MTRVTRVTRVTRGPAGPVAAGEVSHVTPPEETSPAPGTSYLRTPAHPHFPGIMTRHQQPRRLELSPAQIAGSALAAMSGAFFASWAGTTGTLVGAALGSMIATVGAATYTWSLRRTSDAVRRTAGQVRQGYPSGARRDLPWTRLALASLAVMVAAMTGITALEALTGHSVSSYTGGSQRHGTTIGHLLETHPADRKDRATRRPGTPETGATTSRSGSTTPPPAGPQPTAPVTPNPATGPTPSPGDATIPPQTVPATPGPSTAPGDPAQH